MDNVLYDPLSGSPAVEVAGVETPGVGKPGVDTPGVEKPGVEKPGVDTPGVEKPGFDTPGVETAGESALEVDASELELLAGEMGDDTPGVEITVTLEPSVSSASQAYSHTFPVNDTNTPTRNANSTHPVHCLRVAHRIVRR